MLWFPKKRESGLRIPAGVELARVFDRLKNRAEVSDRAFDRIFPDWARRLSKVHWTPVEVAVRATDLLSAGISNCRMLDVGSGTGKFCLIAACCSNAIRVDGVEQRARFVELSAGLAARYRIGNVHFLPANAGEIDWSCYNVVYLFNPFYEHRSWARRIDSTIATDSRLFDAYVSMTQRKLACMREGTRVATYHGFGGSLPSSYVKIQHEFHHSGFLEVWEKTG